MKPQLTTTPDRLDIHIQGDLFTSYLLGDPAFGFTALNAGDRKALTQPDANSGVSLWLMHGNVNGLSFGLGGAAAGDAGTLVTRDLLARRGTHSVGFLHEIDWLAPDGGALLRETRTIRAAVGPSAGASLDFGCAFSCMAESAVVLGRTEEAFLCLRVAPTLLPAGGGQLRNSHDEFDVAATHNRPADWIACTGVVRGETVGLAFYDHPDNPWHPSRWTVRADGLISPSPFGWQEVTIPRGGKLIVRYRIQVHAGYVEAGWVRARLADWLRS